jgi:hypothetical protein
LRFIADDAADAAIEMRVGEAGAVSVIGEEGEDGGAVGTEAGDEVGEDGGEAGEDGGAVGTEAGDEVGEDGGEAGEDGGVVGGEAGEDGGVVGCEAGKDGTEGNFDDMTFTTCASGEDQSIQKMPRASRSVVRSSMHVGSSGSMSNMK